MGLMLGGQKSALRTIAQWLILGAIVGAVIPAHRTVYRAGPSAA